MTSLYDQIKRVDKQCIDSDLDIKAPDDERDMQFIYPGNVLTGSDEEGGDTTPSSQSRGPARKELHIPSMCTDTALDPTVWVVRACWACPSFELKRWLLRLAIGQWGSLRARDGPQY